jgi:predicted HicB family RNase H-like nuclease
MKRKYIVYMHQNKTNNKIYIGCTSLNLKQRSGKNGVNYKNQKKFYNDILKYGWDNFKHIILFESFSKKEMVEKEIELIKKYNSVKNGYNTTNGGENNTTSLKLQVNITISKKLKEELIKEAEENGLTLNSYIRMILIQRRN